MIFPEEGITLRVTDRKLLDFFFQRDSVELNGGLRQYFSFGFFFYFRRDFPELSPSCECRKEARGQFALDGCDILTGEAEKVITCRSPPYIRREKSVKGNFEKGP